MKNLKYSLCFGLFTLCITALSTMSASAETPRTAIVNPGEDATKSVRINWHSDLEGPETYCFYTTADDTEWTKAQRVEPTREECDVFDGMYSKTAANENYYESARFIRNVASIDGLQPGTKYMYRLGNVSEGDIRYL